ncbi:MULTISPECIES: hypothetical protein [unclassified Moorena]|nr:MULTISPECIES: hypothetical protein [unclassified Moorena]
MSPPATGIYYYCCHCRQQMPMLEETILTESVPCGDKNLININQE